MKTFPLAIFFTAFHLISPWSINDSPQSTFDGSFNSLQPEVPENRADPRLIFIFPGTKWCGSGDIAKDENDLGLISDTDSCCRDHDFCPDIIKSGKSAHGLTNRALYTRLSCECDMRFLQCLRDSGTSLSKTIGVIYFNTLQTKCFKLEYPVIKCARYSNLGSKCLEYQFNTTAAKTYQWFDVPFF